MQYGLIGEKLGHSFSKEVHALIGDYDYQLKEVQPKDLKTFILSKGFKGLNVTIPYKQSVIELLDFVDENALLIGAVNTVVNRDGKLFGYNTDCLGVKSLIDKVGLNLQGKKVAILGTGGTSKTVFSVVSNLGAKEILKVSRSKSDTCINYEELYLKHFDADVIINTTPVGMYPNVNDKLLDLTRFDKLEGVVDAIYNPLRTQLVLSAKELGIKADGGLYMLVAQAVYAYGYFFNKEIDSSIIDDIYLKVLRQKQNVVLVGMPSCGKSTIGKIISQNLGLEFIDTDEIIEAEKNQKIYNIFANLGEAEFRKIEIEVVSKVSLKVGKVISTGGGVILNSENVKKLKQNGKIFFIDRDLEKLVATNDRPLSNDTDKLKNLYLDRYPKYLKCADVKIENDSLIDQAVDKIIKEL
ncbi:MAG: shikimate dehydrogenase [Clostridia bacterium]|nr:shikimate dehydrogenase [Clostridia bacterium]